MILQQYYEQKKEKISNLINENFGNEFRIGLYNDRIYDEEDEDEPVIMFKYNDVVWNTSSEQEYKADVNFSVFVVLNNKFEEDYILSFELARLVDQAILLHPDRAEIRENQDEIENGNTEIELITNAAFKIREGLYTVEEDHWKKNNFYIWEITYKTTLIEREYKKRYTMITNRFFTRRQLERNEEQIRKNLRELGYDLDDYNQVTYKGKELLIYKNVREQLEINDTKKVNLKGD